MQALGLILAGGKSSRMGENKAFIKLGDKTLLEHVYARLKPQCEQILVSTSSDDPRFLPYQTISDSVTGQLGPLAGILAGLEHAAKNNHKCIVTTPVDCPFLPDDLVERFILNAQVSRSPHTDSVYPICTVIDENIEYIRYSSVEGVAQRRERGLSNTKIIIACSNNQPHYTTGLWHISLINPLKHALNNGIRKVQDFTNAQNPHYINWDTAPFDLFININTQTDLTLASTCLNSASATPI